MDIVKEIELLEKDHLPDGWPAVNMRLLTKAKLEIERLQVKIEEAWDDGYTVGKYNKENDIYPEERRYVFVMSVIEGV